MTFGIFTSCYGYEPWLPEWEASIRAAGPDEVVIVGDEAAQRAWGRLGRFVLAPELGNPYRQAAAHNRGAAELSTEWAMHVGVDDLVYPNLVSELSKRFDGADVVAVDVTSEKDGQPVRTRRNRPTREKILKPTMGQQPLDACAAFRRSLWEAHPYNEEIAGGCDVALWIGFAHAGARFAFTAKPGVRYRLHADSLWHSRPKAELIALRETLNGLRQPPGPRVSVAVMAHPSRKGCVSELLAALDRPAEVVWDEKRDLWDTGRRSLLAYDPQATHHLVIQDDALVCRDLVAGVERALHCVPPDVLLGLYLGHHPPHSYMVSQLVSQAGSASWLSMAAINWGVAVVVPTGYIADLVAFGDQLAIPSYDQRIGRWCRKRRIKAWYPWPSLVEHRGVPSLIGRRDGRKARKFIGANVSALSLSFGDGVRELPLSVKRDARREVLATRRWRHRDGRVRKVTVGTDLDLRYEALTEWEEVAHVPAVAG